jgi:hypothetical protein
MSGYNIPGPNVRGQNVRGQNVPGRNVRGCIILVPLNLTWLEVGETVSSLTLWRAYQQTTVTITIDDKR